MTVKTDVLQYKDLYIVEEGNCFIIMNKTSNIVGKADNLLEARLLIDMIRG